MNGHTADDITSTLLKATDVQSIDWQSLRGIARQVYSESCFGRYAKLDKDNNPLCAIVDDPKYLYRRVFVDGWPVWGLTTMWLNDLKPGDMPDWILAPFGTYAEVA
jgi:hypothetical protein